MKRAPKQGDIIETFPGARFLVITEPSEPDRFGTSETTIYFLQGDSEIKGKIQCWIIEQGMLKMFTLISEI